MRMVGIECTSHMRCSSSDLEYYLWSYRGSHSSFITSKNTKKTATKRFGAHELEQQSIALRANSLIQQKCLRFGINVTEGIIIICMMLTGANSI